MVGRVTSTGVYTTFMASPGGIITNERWSSSPSVTVMLVSVKTTRWSGPRTKDCGGPPCQCSSATHIVGASPSSRCRMKNARVADTSANGPSCLAARRKRPHARSLSPPAPLDSYASARKNCATGSGPGAPRHPPAAAGYARQCDDRHAALLGCRPPCWIGRQPRWPQMRTHIQPPHILSFALVRIPEANHDPRTSGQSWWRASCQFDNSGRSFHRHYKSERSALGRHSASALLRSKWLGDLNRAEWRRGQEPVLFAIR